jgi:peptidoglycan hydrolase-like protein with peptidoglycan-binding domain
MQSGVPIRSWAGAILCGLLCLAAQSSAAAAADTSTKNSASSSPAHPVSVKHSQPKSSTGKHSSKGKHSRGKAKGKGKRGQQAIDSPRAREIQEALIQQNYLKGEPSGKWDDATQEAMKRYQAAQGWQAKTVPDSRALIKLGLGPSKDGLLNPETAMTTGPAAGSGPKVVTSQPMDDPVNPSSSPPDENKPQP